MRSTFTRGALLATAACLAISAVAGAPASAAAQSAPAPAQSAPPQADCEQQKTNDTILGVLIGAVAGGIFGSNVAAAGHRGDGTALGAAVGGLGGGLIGASAANCGAPQTYYDNGAYKEGYADRNVRYGAPPAQQPPADADAGPPQGAQADGGYQDAPPAQPASSADQGYNDPPSDAAH